jgi:glycogen phosphorylase
MDRKTDRTSDTCAHPMTVASIIESINRNARYAICSELDGLGRQNQLLAVSLALRELIVDGYLRTYQRMNEQDPKKVYYLSMEFLIGQSLGNNLTNLGLYDLFKTALADLNLDLDAIIETESDAALGNGGLGRLAACFLDSMASLNLPGFGYGINYEYGLFKQSLSDGQQQEHPDKWRESESPWQFERSDKICPIPMYGHVEDSLDKNGHYNPMWLGWNLVLGLPYDMPIVGYGGKTVNSLRLYSAVASHQFDIDIFNEGDFFRAVQQKIESETISKVLYPSDMIASGLELRLVQEYFLVACAIRDITRLYQEKHASFEIFHEKVAIHLNDTHPALAIPELMRLLVDEKSLPWEKAWEITLGTFGYTNHTLLPEALEKWPVELIRKVIPRHLQIIFEINRCFLDEIKLQGHWDAGETRALSMIEEGSGKQVRMANLAIIGSHSVNGVSELHSRLVTQSLVPSFFRLWPEKFNNKTNGITPRRWLLKSNPALARLITASIGDRWILDLSHLRDLAEYSTDSGFRTDFQKIKTENKAFLARTIRTLTGTTVDTDSIFDVQIKRIHEYKRQLLNMLHIVFCYLRVIEDGKLPPVPKTYIFAGKAAPGYQRAKQIIRFIIKMGDIINRDPRTQGSLKVVFLPDYRVSLAEKIVPAADISEQISTAGKEASGTGNMKLALNGALTVGTLDGANIEMLTEIGKDHMFIFGLTETDIAEQTRTNTYHPHQIYTNNPEIQRTIDFVVSETVKGQASEDFGWIKDVLVHGGDQYFHLADFPSYCEIQQHASEVYMRPEEWTEKAILNVAGMGKFSSDRTILEYASEIWQVKPLCPST